MVDNSVRPTARDLHVPKAEHMFRKSLKLREENEEFRVLKFKPFPEEMLENFPFRVPGNDKQGCPVVFVPAGIWPIKALAQEGRSRELVYHVCRIIERYAKYFKLFHSPETFSTQTILILDLNYMSIPQTASKPVVNFFQDLTRCLDSNFPELLKACYVVNAPKLFSMLWTIVKPFLAPRTLEKVKVIGTGRDQIKKALLEFIDYRELPSEYGGSNTIAPFYTNQRGEVPLPRAHFFNSDDFTTTTVPAKEKLVKNFELCHGDRITWNFKTDIYDIGFGFFHNGLPMVPFIRTDSHIFVQDGLHDVLQHGSYSLIFDNSHSRYRPKTLHYVIHVDQNFRG